MDAVFFPRDRTTISVILAAEKRQHGTRAYVDGVSPAASLTAGCSGSHFVLKNQMKNVFRIITETIARFENIVKHS